MMLKRPQTITDTLIVLLLMGMLVSACQPLPQSAVNAQPLAQEQVPPNESLSTEDALVDIPAVTPLPTRPAYSPGELVDYEAQTGDTLPALASHFNTQEDEIRAANLIIPQDVSTLPPGLPMQIPIYYAPLWGSPYKILPDNLFINGPAQIDFDTSTFVADHPGWLKDYVGFAADANRSGAQIVDVVALNFSVSPRLLLALLEYQAGALSQPQASPDLDGYVLGYQDRNHRGVYLQLVWAANTLNNAYYGWRTGDLNSIDHLDGTIERPDPWQNAATVAVQFYFSRLLGSDDYAQAISSDGFAKTYKGLYGDPWETDQPHIPGSLAQPMLRLPFEVGTTWAFTGGPHTGWGTGPPLAALDFAPPTVVGGCVSTDEWATAVAPGIVARSEPGIVVLDLDGDGDEHTGWVIFHLHVAEGGRAPQGVQLQTGDPIGHPSCEGGSSTGTHIHIARKYNGEWISASGPLAFNLEGWIAHNGAQPYQGSLTRFSRTVTACECSNGESFIQSEAP